MPREWILEIGPRASFVSSVVLANATFDGDAVHSEVSRYHGSI